MPFAYGIRYLFPPSVFSQTCTLDTHGSTTSSFTFVNIFPRVLLRFLLSESNHHRERKQQLVEICLIFIVVIRIIILDIGSTQLLGKEKSPHFPTRKFLMVKNHQLQFHLLSTIFLLEQSVLEDHNQQHS